FLFFLGDAKGRLVVAEGIPGMLRIDEEKPVLCRANHFLLPDIQRKSRQSLPPDRVYDTRRRHEEIARAAGTSKRLTLKGLKRALSQPPVYRFGLETVTVDSLCIVSGERRLQVRRGGPTPNRWRSHTIPWRK